MKKRICVNWLGNVHHSSKCYHYMSLEAGGGVGGGGGGGNIHLVEALQLI